MQDRRIETAPAWLVALAAGALGMSWAVTQQWSAPAPRYAVDQPSRTTAPLRWRVAELAPLAAPQLPEESVGLTFSSLTSPLLYVRIDAPALDPTVNLSFAASTLAEPSRASVAPLGAIPHIPAPARKSEPEPAKTSVSYAGRMILLIPAEPLWRAGGSAPVVVTGAMRRDWSIGPFDTLALAKAAGGVIADPQKLIDEAPLRSVSRLTKNVFASAPRGKQVRVAATAPRLVGPDRPAPRVAPIELPLEYETPTIARYLERAPSTGAFPVPVAIGGQLDRVAESRELAPWAWAVAYRLRTLASTPVDDVSAHRGLGALSDAADEAFAQAALLGDAPQATELRRAGYALSRRLTTWRAEQTRTLVLLQQPGLDPLAGARWAMSPHGLGMSPGVLLCEPEGFGVEPPTLRVAQRAEAYEQSPSTRLARALANDVALLHEANDQEARDMAAALEGAYRNANVRVAIAAELIDRMIPQPEPITSAVRDRIAGNPVSGRSTTRTELSIRLVEDPAAWRLGLEARGLITAQTYSRGGPARLGAQGSTSFVAKKLVVLTPGGLQAAPAVATAKSESQRLTSLSTSYDRVPVLGDYVRSSARSEYSRVRPRALAETRMKVEQQASRTLDERITPRLAEIEQRFADEVVARAETLGLRIEPIEMRTTQARLITRVRLAGDSQLAAHTPRMRAPSDSLFSLQMHESTLNNMLEGLELSGASVTPQELRDRLVERLRLPTRLEEAPDQALIRFAKEDAVRFELSEGRAHLTLAIDEISVRGRRQRNFKVHAFYRPEANGLTAELVQDGAPYIEGRMRNSSRLHLHAVMGKVLGENQRLPIVRFTENTPERVVAALDGLVTNQFVIEDGWLGLAIGPERAPGRMAAQIGGYVR